MYVSVNIWFLCFVIAAVCCCIHVCSVTGEISQRKRRRRAKTTELKQLFSKNYLNSPGGFKVRPGTPPFILAQRPRIETSRIAFYVQRARLKASTYQCIAVIPTSWRRPSSLLECRCQRKRGAERRNPAHRRRNQQTPPSFHMGRRSSYLRQISANLQQNDRGWMLITSTRVTMQCTSQQ